MGSNSGYRIMSIKTVAASVAVLSTAVMLHVSGPSIVRFASAEIPKIYGSLISWLAPPYLYFVINGIIISIAASSRFQKSGSDDVGHIGSATESGSGSAPVVKQQEFIVVSAPAPVVEEQVKVLPAEYGTAALEKESNKEEEEEEKVEEEEEEFVISRSIWAPKRRETVTEISTEYSFLKEKPLVSARLGRRKSLKSSPDQAGRALGVARPKRYDTLESTWKAITDGRAVPLTRHLKKSDTWETHQPHHTRASRDDPPTPEEPAVMRKSETFHERGAGGARRPPTSGSPSSLGASPAARLRKEPSVGQDDLNRRVEAFIKKFNEEMRLQRQESFKQYSDMINRGSQ